MPAPTAANIGCRVSIKSLGTTVEGVVFTVDGGCVVLEQFSSSSLGDSKATYTVLNAAAIDEFAVLAEVPANLAKEATLPAINSEFLTAREERAVVRAGDDSKNINPNATTRTQAVYEALSKTMPTKWLNPDGANSSPSILLFEDIIIPPSMRPEDCKARGGEERLLERVQKVLSGIHKKLDADPRTALAQ